ncbi:hypothetical protein SEA_PHRAPPUCCINO_122 [Mycobacterium phage Phrappuccino]|uniref:Uncharacterized protein n=1 Tax=Mycobacterium phage Phrappuccino TaxID=2591223 RepID=A0A514DDX6_9CAUD|nr:hypothetical protein KHQ87_gp122 [Mycobacterium phage Phrappuccino]QDH91797.1 hypothetical protein SEA_PHRAPPUCCINO_122 [Mycobacterium phage Phrappuccino]QIQ63239.1 hypothetical protein SEA_SETTECANDELA_122 [Mycobacterium phage Settecandela]
MIRWWHRAVLGHTQEHRRVTVPLFDPFAKGELIVCSCHRSWAR